MRSRLAALGATAALGLGGLAVVATSPLGIAGAQGAPATTESGGQGALGTALDALVADGTLTQEQADAVVDAVRDERRGDRETRRARRSETLAAAAEAIGSSPRDVRSALRDGTSLAAQAEAAGVDRQVVDDAVTASITAHLDDAVASGAITEERAAKVTAKLDRVVDRILDADGSQRPG